MPASEPTRILAEHILHAAHYLPAQGPLSVFVHHNTLHAWESTSFENAVTEASELFGAQPYLSEEGYRQEFSRARILERDLRSVVAAELQGDAEVRIAGLTTRFALRIAMLFHPILRPRGAELEWLLAETDALSRFRGDLEPEVKRKLMGRAWSTYGRDIQPEKLERLAVRSLWDACEKSVQRIPLEKTEPQRFVRRRDLLLAVIQEDSDALVHPLLIRYLSAFLDQGLAYWPMPDRDKGLYRCFLQLYSQTNALRDRWTLGLSEVLAKESAEEISPEESVLRSLSLLGVQEEEQQTFIQEMLLALRGWAGMIRQIDERPERFFDHVPKANLVEYLAVRLLLERQALSFLARDRLSYEGPLSDLKGSLLRAYKPPQTVINTHRELADFLFQLSQILGISAEEIGRLSTFQVQEFLREAESFTSMERRRLFHVAYERRHMVELMDALLAHSKEGAPPQKKTEYQAVFCIDDREESLRRHLEEVYPGVSTYGYPGFFGVAMYYRGEFDTHPSALCPVSIKPQHEVEEHEQEQSSVQKLQLSSRRLLGQAARAWMIGNRTFTRGTMMTALLGAIAAIPLVSRVLFPRLTARFMKQTERLLQSDAHTFLTLERSEATPRFASFSGFTKEEMHNIVAKLLEDIGLKENFAPLVFVVGHGSSSINNPHEAAYNCGACGSGRGGPNARAFAQMANDPEVRALLRARGITIPEETWFIGGYHNTGDDSLSYFDLEHLPAQSKEPFIKAQALFTEALSRNAHERCRRFEAAPSWFTPALSLSHVESRTSDLAQTRPEYNHATNAAFFVGRRERTRGLFLDRRVFMASYEPTQDDEDGAILARILGAAIPVCAGINLEYYFSSVDNTKYGSGTKLPHNITGLIGVMDGHSSDLRTGLSSQMVEIHEPVRLLAIVEAPVERLQRVISQSVALTRLIQNRWVRLVALHPSLPEASVFQAEGFVPYVPESEVLLSVSASVDWYRGRREHLPCARITGEGEGRGV
jgi:uncharacterized protein YbcC (UPF0753/DUF2309 family)